MVGWFLPAAKPTGQWMQSVGIGVVVGVIGVVGVGVVGVVGVRGQY